MQEWLAVRDELLGGADPKRNDERADVARLKGRKVESGYAHDTDSDVDITEELGGRWQNILTGSLSSKQLNCNFHDFSESWKTENATKSLSKPVTAVTRDGGQSTFASNRLRRFAAGRITRRVAIGCGLASTPTVVRVTESVGAMAKKTIVGHSKRIDPADFGIDLAAILDEVRSHLAGKTNA